MKIKIIITLLIFSVVTIIWGQAKSISLPTVKTPQATPKELCGVKTKDLLFCTTTPIVEAGSGQNVIVEVSLQNVSSETITVPQIGGFYRNYEVIVENSSGSKLYSKIEKLQKKYQDGTISAEEQSQLLPAGNGPFTFDLPPKKNMKWQINLSDFYDFKSPGDYEVTIGRRITKLNKEESIIVPQEVVKARGGAADMINVAKKETYVVPLRESIKVKISN